MPLKQCLPNEDKDIKSDIAPARNQPEQHIRVKGAQTDRTLSYRLVGDEWSNHAQYFFASSLLHEKPCATLAGIPFRSETDNRRFREQHGGQCLL
jgi:hypothetical protein